MRATVFHCSTFILMLDLFLCRSLPLHDQRSISSYKQVPWSPTRYSPAEASLLEFGGGQLVSLFADSEKKETAAVRDMKEWPQRNHRISVKSTGSLEQDTLNKVHNMKFVMAPGNNTAFWKRPRCGVPDYPTSMSFYKLKKKKKAAPSGQWRRKRFAVFGGSWQKTDLTYKIVRFPWQMNEDKVRRVLLEAAGVWGEVTPLTFREVTIGEADISIDFDRYWHGDSLPFDGPGGTLAHAFFPQTHRQGEIHFDYDEDWTVGNGVGTDLLQVAAHEFGHVLGLQHSLVPGAVMSPFYSDTYPLLLSEDDKRGIQYLYGPRQHIQPDITETNEIDTGVPDSCRSTFDAVSMIRGELFFFKSQYVWRIRDGQLQPGYPALASRHWRGIPDHIDAAYEDKSGNIWFFQGDNYWVFDAERKITGPDSLRRLGVPVTHIQAAMKWKPEQKVYIFKSGAYWSFSAESNRVDSLDYHSMQYWGVPGNIDAAFQDSHGYANFLSGLHYWKFDPAELKVLEGYPRSVGMDFFGCTALSV
ncbi:stromelysin-3-like [Genypterus blacodes]|uniref:stromelysin-3-like n=1 Tax=Genypterus blacodes TaxID=154954 RepID=UPI003F764BAE